MKVQYRQRQHSFGPHAQLLFQGSNEAAQELISWCESNLIPHTWDYQVWDIGQQTYLQVDSIDPGTIMLFKLTYG